jgi:hypothetical protein
MDPRKQECIGFYLYGAGYFSRDENTLGLVTAAPLPTTATRHFCARCPAVEECERRQHQRVAAERPEQTRHFDDAIERVSRHGIAPETAAYVLAQRGLNPHFADAMDNFKRGHADRGRLAGPLTQ